MPNYGDQKYWEERYKSQKGTCFDWLEDYETLKEIFEELKIDKSTGNIINIGCGNAELEEKMCDEGYRNIVNIDISENVIEYKQERNKNRKELTCNYPLIYLFR